jgi:serine/threonine protein kinase
MNEKELLQKLNHPFIVNMAYAFQDSENLYLVMDYLNGGDLRYHMGNRRKFTENESKFIIACIIVALQYLHMNNVIHRDLNPETSGTPGYMAPEVICRRDHSFPVDFFALGVIAY